MLDWSSAFRAHQSFMSYSPTHFNNDTIYASSSNAFIQSITSLCPTARGPRAEYKVSKRKYYLLHEQYYLEKNSWNTNDHNSYPYFKAPLTTHRLLCVKNINYYFLHWIFTFQAHQPFFTSWILHYHHSHTASAATRTQHWHCSNLNVPAIPFDSNSATKRTRLIMYCENPWRICQFYRRLLCSSRTWRLYWQQKTFSPSAKSMSCPKIIERLLFQNWRPPQLKSGGHT